MAREADPEAFAELFRLTRHRTTGLAYRILRDHGLAEEAVQEAYLELWVTATRYDPRRGSALGWLLTLVRHRAIDRARSSESAARRDDDYQPLIPVIDDLTEHVHAKMVGDRVRAGIRALPFQERQALHLAFWGGMSQSEIAASVGVPLGTVKSRTRTALRRLRDGLGGEPPDREPPST